MYGLMARKKDSHRIIGYLYLEGLPGNGKREREQYYLHNFLSEQPDLNFYNEEVQKNLLSILDFWLKLGVRGIRLDTVNFYFHDEKLRNNPKRDTKKYPLLKSEKTNPYHSQRHLYDKSQKINIEFLQKLRKVADKYDDVLLMGELGGS